MNCTLWTDLSKILKGNFMKRSLCQRPDEVQSARCLFLTVPIDATMQTFGLFSLACLEIVIFYSSVNNCLSNSH